MILWIFVVFFTWEDTEYVQKWKDSKVSKIMGTHSNDHILRSLLTVNMVEYYVHFWPTLFLK